MALFGLAASLVGAAAPARARAAASVALTVGRVCLRVRPGRRRARDRPRRLVPYHPAAPLARVLAAPRPVGALFVAVTAVIGICATVFRLGYRGHGLASRTASCVLPLFVTTPAARARGRRASATFMFFWELMALTSLLLVLVDHRHRAEVARPRPVVRGDDPVRRGGILVGLVLLATHAGGQSFAADRRPRPAPRALGALARLRAWRWSASAPRPGPCRSTCGCPGPTPRRRARSRRSCRRPWSTSASTASSASATTCSAADRRGGGSSSWRFGGAVGPVRFAARGDQHRPQAPAGLLHDRQHRPRAARGRAPRASSPRPATAPAPLSPWWPPSCTWSTTPCSRGRCSSRPVRSSRRPGPRPRPARRPVAAHAATARPSSWWRPSPSPPCRRSAAS